MVLLGFVTESRDVSIAIANPIAIAMECGGGSFPGTWMDGMNADDAPD